MGVVDRDSEDERSSSTALLCLRVEAEVDPAAIIRVLERFQALNIIPRRVRADLASNGVIYIEVQVTDLTEHRLTLITAKIGQIPTTLDACWH